MSNSNRIRSFCLLWMIMVSLIPLTAADSSIGAHMGLDIDQTGAVQVRPGIDIRTLGGRGIFGTDVSIDYFPVNSRGYHGAEPSDMLMVSVFGLGQLSMWYGDVAFYSGLGTSYYYMPNIDGFLSLIEDNVVHTKLGFLYTIYPIQMFIDMDFDIFFDVFRFDYSHPHVTIGATFIR